MSLRSIFLSLMLGAILMAPNMGNAATQPFDQWLNEMRAEASSRGIHPNIISQALPATIKPIPRIIELDRKQPEGSMSFDEYRKKIVNQARINKGRDMMRRYARELNAVSAVYDVPPQYIVALWGIETNFGSNTGGFDVVNALATLAYDGRRSDYFRGELMNALKILNEGHILPQDMKGSWAGAMGQSQFMPSSFLSYAVDFDKDGRRDIWNTQLDVFASAANYLKSHGWKGDELWGREVTVPPGFLKSLEGLKVEKSLGTWNAIGVRDVHGNALPNVAGMNASIVQPDGANGSAYLVYNNYRTIMRWNKSTYFATSVGLLANAVSTY